ncbi:MAG: hypothetical protein AAFU73_03425 [Planctomycetota bacterium]
MSLRYICCMLAASIGLVLPANSLQGDVGDGGYSNIRVGSCDASADSSEYEQCVLYNPYSMSNVCYILFVNCSGGGYPLDGICADRGGGAVTVRPCKVKCRAKIYVYDQATGMAVAAPCPEDHPLHSPEGQADLATNTALYPDCAFWHLEADGRTPEWRTDPPGADVTDPGGNDATGTQGRTSEVDVAPPGGTLACGESLNYELSVTSGGNPSITLTSDVTFGCSQCD